MGFSVLISLYIKEKPEYLDRCFLSIYEQTLSANEIVLILDGDITDEQNFIIQKWSKMLPIKVFPLLKNVGLGKALNIGLKKCQHDIVLRMDTDDICINTRFEVQYNYLVANPDIAILGSHINEFIDNENYYIGRRLVPCINSEIKKYSQKRNPFNHMTVGFRKSVIEKVGGYKHHHFMEDYNLWLRVIAAGYQVGNINQCLVKVRVGKGMLERRSGIEYIKSEYKLAILKYKLGIQKSSGALIIFLIRSIPRLFPVGILGIFYKKLRRA
ncbi:glycosyltransferase [Salmonella enterica]|nr:glycosyltransferase [Salmonella enterica]